MIVLAGDDLFRNPAGGNVTKTFGWRDLAWAAGIVIAAVAAFFLFRTPEPARTGLTLVAAVCGDPAERRALIERHVARALDVRAADAITGSDGQRELSHSDLERELAKLDAMWPACTFSLKDWVIRPHTSAANWLEGSLEYSASEATDLHAQRRPLRALFREVGGEQRLERLLLGEPERHLPEARP